MICFIDLHMVGLFSKLCIQLSFKIDYIKAFGIHCRFKWYPLYCILDGLLASWCSWELVCDIGNFYPRSLFWKYSHCVIYCFIVVSDTEIEFCSVWNIFPLILKKIDFYTCVGIKNGGFCFMIQGYDVLTLYSQLKWKTAWLLLGKMVKYLTHLNIFSKMAF